jgi:triacylglycerol lipase
MSRTITAGVLGVLALAAAVVPATAAGAAVTGCAAAENALYTPPATVTGPPGTVLACRPVTLPEVPGGLAMNAWQVQYASTDRTGRPVAVSGTVAVPTAPWTGAGRRPVVSFHFGTLGLGPQCAFSRQLAGAYQDEYEGDQVAAVLKAGWAVVATDDAGYLTGQTHTYMVGATSAHAMLDGVRAAFRLPGDGLSSTAKVGLWGYSQGGAATLWAAQSAASYAPELSVAGAAAGGVPGDLRAVAEASNGGAFAGFTVDATIGLHTAYPGLPFDALLNEAGRQLVANLKTLCLTGTIAAGAGARTENLTTGGLTLDQLLQIWGGAVDEQKLGVGLGTAYAMRFPILQYHGLLDEVVPTSVEDAVHAAYCQGGVTTQQNLYAADHLLADNQAIGDVVSWLGDRFAGRSTSGNC